MWPTWPSARRGTPRSGDRRDQLGSAIDSRGPDGPGRIAPQFTLIAASGPDNPGHAERTAELRRLLSDGHRNLELDPAPTPALGLLVRDGWPQQLAADVQPLAGVIVSRVVDVPEVAAPTPSDPQEEPAHG